MAIDITLPIAMRMAGPALFVILGGAMAALSGRDRARASLGALFGGLGLSLVGANVGLAGGGAPAFYVATLGSAICAAGFVAWLIVLPSGSRPRRAELVALAAFVAVDFVAEARSVGMLVSHNEVFSKLPTDVLPSFVFYGYFASLYQAVLLAAPIALALHAVRAEANERATAAALAAGLLVFNGFGVGADLLSGSNVGVFIEPRLALVAIVASAVLWLWVGERSASRGSRNVALAALFATLLGMIRHVTSGFDNAVDPLGASGIARLGGWAVVTVAIVRAGWLDTTFLSRHRTATAAGALALLFIVAQIAQNFFSAEFGLLTGGIIAGAFLFMASPLQRAMESMRERRPQEGAALPSALSRTVSPEGAEAYRHALRAAMRDGHLSRREERHLAELARVLGIDAAHALDLREEIEKEAAR